MWLATLMGSDIIKEADDKKLIKQFICNPGLINVMLDESKGDSKKTKKEVVRICGTVGSGDDSGTTALNADTTGSGGNNQGNGQGPFTKTKTTKTGKKDKDGFETRVLV